MTMSSVSSDSRPVPSSSAIAGAARCLTALLALSAAPMLTACAAGAQWDGGAYEEDQEAVDWGTVEIGRPTEKCAYPQAQIGVAPGETIDSQLKWQGYADDTDLKDVEITKYFDCVGRRDTNALLILQSATWCGVCQQEATEVSAHLADKNDWPAKGIKVLTLMIEDIDGSKATASTALNWRNQFNLESTFVAFDPDFTFAPHVSEIGLPVLISVDPRTMEIKDVQQGISGNGDHNILEGIAEANAAK